MSWLTHFTILIIFLASQKANAQLCPDIEGFFLQTHGMIDPLCAKYRNGFNDALEDCGKNALDQDRFLRHCSRAEIDDPQSRLNKLYQREKMIRLMKMEIQYLTRILTSGYVKDFEYSYKIFEDKWKKRFKGNPGAMEIDQTDVISPMYRGGLNALYSRLTSGEHKAKMYEGKNALETYFHTGADPEAGLLVNAAYINFLKTEPAKRAVTIHYIKARTESVLYPNFVQKHAEQVYDNPSIRARTYLPDMVNSVLPTSKYEASAALRKEAVKKYEEFKNLESAEILVDFPEMQVESRLKATLYSNIKNRLSDADYENYAKILVEPPIATENGAETKESQQTDPGKLVMAQIAAKLNEKPLNSAERSIIKNQFISGFNKVTSDLDDEYGKKPGLDGLNSNELSFLAGAMRATDRNIEGVTKIVPTLQALYCHQKRTHSIIERDKEIVIGTISFAAAVAGLGVLPMALVSGRSAAFLIKASLPASMLSDAGKLMQSNERIGNAQKQLVMGNQLLNASELSRITAYQEKHLKIAQDLFKAGRLDQSALDDLTKKQALQLWEMGITVAEDKTNLNTYALREEFNKELLSSITSNLSTAPIWKLSNLRNKIDERVKEFERLEELGRMAEALDVKQEVFALNKNLQTVMRYNYAFDSMSVVDSIKNGDPLSAGVTAFFTGIDKTFSKPPAILKK